MAKMRNKTKTKIFKGGVKMYEILKELEILTNEIKAKTSKVDEFEKQLDSIAKQLNSITEEIAKIKTLAITTPEGTKEKAKKEFGSYIKKAVTTGSTGVEYVLPVEIYSEVQDMINKYGVIAKLSKEIPMASKTLKVPAAGAVDIYYPDEGVDITESNNIFSNGLILTEKKQTALVNISREMLKWSEVQLANYVSELIARDMAKEEDRQALLGTGAPFNGIGYNASVPAVIGPSAGYNWIDSEQIINAIGLVDSDYQTSDVVLIMNSVVFFSIFRKQKKITNTVDGYIIDAMVGLNPPTIAGYRVFYSKVIPNSTTGSNLPYVIVGNFADGHLRGIGQEITVELSKDYNFAKDLITIKATRLHSVGNIISKAFARMVSANS
jgi:HK97 family phage major capsid protein